MGCRNSYRIHVDPPVDPMGFANFTGVGSGVIKIDENFWWGSNLIVKMYDAFEGFPPK